MCGLSQVQRRAATSEATYCKRHVWRADGKKCRLSRRSPGSIQSFSHTLAHSATQVPDRFTSLYREDSLSPTSTPDARQNSTARDFLTQRSSLSLSPNSPDPFSFFFSNVRQGNAIINRLIPLLESTSTSFQTFIHSLSSVLFSNFSR